MLDGDDVEVAGAGRGCGALTSAAEEQPADGARAASFASQREEMRPLSQEGNTHPSGLERPLALT